MRRPDPFYWKARKAWYVQLQNGKQVKLGFAEKKTSSPPDEVMQEYYRLMAGEGLMTTREKRQSTVYDAVGLFIQSKEDKRDKTIKTCLNYLKPFVKAFKTRKLETFKPKEVSSWVEERETWGESTKHMAIVYVKQLFKWAKDEELIESNPLAKMANSFAMQSREKGISLNEFAAMIEGTNNQSLKVMLRFLRDTGCRPGELCKLSAKHLHPDKSTVTLNPREHKTGGRTSQSKTIYFATPVIAELRDLAKIYPTGPLLRTAKGLPWNTENLQKRVKALREKLGLPAHVVPYASRAAFATRLEQMGMSPMMVAKALGHRSVNTTLQHYFIPESESLNNALDKALGVQVPRVETPEETFARLLAENPGLRDKFNNP